MNDNFTTLMEEINLCIRDVIIPTVCIISDKYGDRSDRNDLLRITAKLLDTAASVNDYSKEKMNG